MSDDWADDPYTIRKYLKTDFPKGCKTCDRSYTTREDYYDNTNLIPDMEQLSEGTEGMIAEWRTCGVCGSCLVIRLMNVRDDSEEGNARRKDFDIKLAEMIKEGMSEEEAKNILRVEFSKRKRAA